VFLECPGPNTAVGSCGHMLHASPWADPEQGDAAVSGFDLRRLFYLEVAARLVVLRNLMARAVEKQGLPRWLLYQLSQDSFNQFTAVFQRMKTYNITADKIVGMLHDVKIAQAALNGAADSSFGAVPVSSLTLFNACRPLVGTPSCTPLRGLTARRYGAGRA
jgi:hypothetical protein